MVVAIAKVALVVVMLAAMATGMWMNSRMLRRAREAGYRYWAINPMSVLSGLRGIEPLIFILALLVAMASIMGLLALNWSCFSEVSCYPQCRFMAPFRTCRLL
jgi:hypothetical protein